ncbi:MAG: hypothetical protein ABIQ01_03785, partial [Pseudolysinimonas sp.]
MTGSWASRSLPARCLLVASAVLTVAAAVASGVLAARQEDEALRVVVLLLSGSGAIAVMVTKLVGARSPRVILDPLAGPLLYLVYCLVLPLAYMQVTGRGIQWMPSSMLNGATVAVLCLSISGFIIGAAAVQILGGPI